MKLRESVLLLTSSILSISLLTACGGGGEGGDTGTQQIQDAQLNGVFIDNFVVNMDYQTENLSGSTGSSGDYTYELLGEKMTFSFGGMTIGHGFADGWLTPYDILNDDGNPVHPINLALFLQSLDDDANPENGIVLPTTASITLPANIDFDNRTEVEQLIIDLGYAPRDITLVEEHLNTQIGHLLKNNVPPGHYANTTYYSYEYNPELSGSDPARGPFECPMQYTDINLEATETSIIGTIIGIDGTEHHFNLLKEMAVGYRYTDTGIVFSLNMARIEYGKITILPQPGSHCFNVFRVDRVDGQIIPPAGEIKDAFPFVDGSHSAVHNYSMGPYYYCESHDGAMDFNFEFKDLDGWVTNATVEWSAGSGASGTIDLLTESADVGHFTTDKVFGANIVTGVRFEEWIEFGLSDAHLVSHPLTSESNPSHLYGTFVLRGLAPDCITVIDGPISMTIKITDNDGKNYSKNYVINNLGDAAPIGETYFVVDEESIDPDDHACLELGGPDAATSAAESNASSDPIELKGWVLGSCPTKYSGSGFGCVYNAGGGNTLTAYFTDLVSPGYCAEGWDTL